MLTVIVSYYKAIDNLKLILKALNLQSCKDFEVIISEDDFNEETINFISQNRSNCNFPIVHVYQDFDKGFRKNEMLNKSVIKAKNEKIAFIDGDCIPHKHFVKSYIKHIEPNSICEGRAVMLDEKTTKYTLENQTLKRLNFKSLMCTSSKAVKEGIYFPCFPLTIAKGGRGIVGRNWGVTKSSLLAVNGFDMDYVHAGVGEDVDIEWRLKKNGAKTISVKNKAIVYHLFHKKVYSEDNVANNYKLMAQKQESNKIFCVNGINKVDFEEKQRKNT
ncbi:MAG: glycosyltransferase [Lentimicrobiaceae bacterium]|nr:glycosyltransferase [Lentimicrobiaceae bacterium]